ncbi:MAG TPA: homoserine dehydrogenase [Candidatus Baltobacteraceae bacterium]
MRSVVGIGLLGCGTVGGGVALCLIRDAAEIEARTGVAFDLRRIAVRDLHKARAALLDGVSFTDRGSEVVEDPEIDLVIECIGGTTVASEAIEEALDRGKHVVTANKDAIATQGPRLSALAAARSAALYYEAAACGAIPIVRALSESLAADHILAIAGVVNGTCTAVLSAMEEGAEYAEAVAEARRLGYAEADPSSDLGGADAAHKLALLLQLGFRSAVVSPRIPRVGIEAIGKRDITRAKMCGYRIRLIAAAARAGREILAQVSPMLVVQDHPFAQARGPQNVICVVARDAGTILMTGAGAGADATASAVMGDVACVLRAVAQRHDLSRGAPRGLAAPEAVIDFGERFAQHPELPHLRIWDDEPRDPRTAVAGRIPSGARRA